MSDVPVHRTELFALGNLIRQSSEYACQPSEHSVQFDVYIYTLLIVVKVG
jgi:hypothetical protein